MKKDKRVSIRVKNPGESTYKKKSEEGWTKGVKYYGYHACLNLWKVRPNDIIRLYIEKQLVKELSPLLKWCAKLGKAYHIVSPEELATVADSVHHEGLCMVASPLENLRFDEMLESLCSKNGRECLVYLDGVQNPHNIGSIMRVCAHFGVKYVLGERSVLPAISPSAYRVAQGGAESVKLVPIDQLQQSLQKLQKAGFTTIASHCHSGKLLYDYQFPKRTLIVMGSESDGIRPQLLKLMQETLMIPGTGLVESLNVSVATALFLGEYWRQLNSGVQ